VVNAWIVDLEVESGQNLRALLLDGLKLIGIESLSLQNRGRDLGGLNRTRYRRALEWRVRRQHDDVRVVMREAAVLGEFFLTV
jgi:hypothetical protein